MASNILNIRLSVCSKTSSEFNADTTTIWLEGEPLFETDTLKLKYGDGIHTYANLQYANITPEDLSVLLSNLVASDSEIELYFNTDESITMDNNIIATDDEAMDYLS